MASAISGLIKTKDVRIAVSANSFTQSSEGLFYRNIFSLETEIGSGHIVLGISMVNGWDGATNYPFGFYLSGGNSSVGIWTTSQSFKLTRSEIRVTYI